jgi:hypothetical protein
LTPSSSSYSALEEADSWEFVSAASGTSLARIDPPNSPTTASITSMRSEIQSQSTRKAWFLCHICPPTSNRFETAQDLQSHSLSAAHASKLFHCPTALLGLKKRPHSKNFSTLSGLAMHVESGACLGGKKAIKNLLLFVNDKLNELGFRQTVFSNDENLLLL